VTPDYRRRHRSGNGLLVLLLVFGIIYASRQNNRTTSPPPRRVSTPVQNPIEDVLRPTTTQYKDGIAAAILIDTSGSMNLKVQDADGSKRPKIDIARRAALELVDEFDKYARDHSGQQILLGIYEFSDRGRGPVCRPVVDLSAPDPKAARDAIEKMKADGDTPIGDAMIVAKKALDRGGLAKRHILVITDGENTQGYSPADVTRVISAQSENDRASIYFVAFDVAAAKFNSVRDSGGLVLSASNETDLQGTLNYLLTGKILAEQPQQHR
jgi:VWA domain-containing protein